MSIASKYLQKLIQMCIFIYILHLYLPDFSVTFCTLLSLALTPQITIDGCTSVFTHRIAGHQHSCVPALQLNSPELDAVIFYITMPYSTQCSNSPLLTKTRHQDNINLDIDASSIGEQ